MASKTLKQEYPLHWLAWHNEFRELDRVLGLKQVSATGRGRSLSLCLLLLWKLDKRTEDKTGALPAVLHLKAKSVLLIRT